ncbi:MAG: ATP-dependent Clp protease proteolytic subunit [Streptosporangiales bacterium]|jgi:ATP-dependent Clp protease protease subunit|nr:ATP-dependent Clp protease proteolytic subunit [Streptosporangiales bacterium]
MADYRFPGPPEFPQPPGSPFPGPPGQPGWPGDPVPPGPAPGTPGPAPGPGAVPPSRTWIDPHTEWQDRLAERLLSQRIVLANGVLDDEAASRLSAQFLALDAESDEPVRLELQNLRAELSAALSVMGVLETTRAPVHAYASGETNGAALGLLASCPRRCAYPNASFLLTEPRAAFGGSVTAVAEREQHVRRLTDSLFYRLAEATGRDVDEIREDARRGRTLTVAEALGYGLVTERVSRPE